MVDIPTLTIIVAGASVVAGVIYYSFQIRHQTKMRQTDLVLRLLSPHFNLSSREMREAYTKVMSCEYKDYNDFIEKYGPFNAEKPEPMAFFMLSSYVGAVGILLHRKLVDIDILADFLGENTISLWEKMKPAINKNRIEHSSIFPFFSHSPNTDSKLFLSLF